MRMDRPVAAFDLDALFPRTLTQLFVEQMIAQGYFTDEAQGVPGASDQTRLARLGRHLKGVAYSDAEEVANALIESERGTGYGFPTNLIYDLKQKGYFLLAISGAPRFVVDGFAYEAGFDKSYGSFFATGASDRFTGAVEDEEVITNRASVLARAVRKEGLTLQNSIGLASSASFIPLLEMTETALAFNPEQELRARAEKRGWKIVLEEQGVVYKL